jgi:hypothetical protein
MRFPLRCLGRDILERTRRRFSRGLAEVLRLLAERFQLRLHEFGLNPPKILEILCLG